MENPSQALPVWRPYTQMKTAPPPLIAVSTMGSRIRLDDGRELIDGVASWWTSCHGYNHPHIRVAVEEQLKRMPHIMFGGITHQPANRLAERLAALSPGDLNHVFFVDSGSVAVEVAMKMAVQYAINKNEKGRTKFVHFRQGYHGDTMGSMSLCDPEEGMHALFEGWLPRQLIADLPRDHQSEIRLEELLAQHKGEIAGVIVEPLVQGVGGMIFHEPECLMRLAGLCKKYELLLICDEIFTGFGRTGTMLACEQAGIVPDILCLGKALSGGTVSLAATLARSHIFEAFWSDRQNAALMHGPTYMANPLACAAANATLDLFETEPRLHQVAAIELQLQRELGPCRLLPGVVDVRVKGAIGVVQLKKIDDVQSLRQAFIARGTWIRAYGDIVYLTPALNIASADLTVLTSAIADTLSTERLYDGAGSRT